MAHPSPGSTREAPRWALTAAGFTVAVIFILCIVALALRGPGTDITGLAVSDPAASAPKHSAEADPGGRDLPGPPPANTRPHTEKAAIHASMQRFVDALNSQDVVQIQGTMCSAIRPEVTHAPDATGRVVLERLFDVEVIGDSAAGSVITHLTRGEQRSSSQENHERFVREDGVWLVCPGAAKDMSI